MFKNTVKTTALLAVLGWTARVGIGSLPGSGGIIIGFAPRPAS